MGRASRSVLTRRHALAAGTAEARLATGRPRRAKTSERDLRHAFRRETVPVRGAGPPPALHRSVRRMAHPRASHAGRSGTASGPRAHGMTLRGGAKTMQRQTLQSPRLQALARGLPSKGCRRSRGEPPGCERQSCAKRLRANATRAVAKQSQRKSRAAREGRRPGTGQFHPQKNARARAPLRAPVPTDASMRLLVRRQSAVLASELMKHRPSLPGTPPRRQRVNSRWNVDRRASKMPVERAKRAGASSLEPRPARRRNAPR